MGRGTIKRQSLLSEFFRSFSPGVILKDLAKRKRVMARSMQLGHCICDPKKDCPCDIFREKDICPCAGERLEQPTGPLKLTELVDSPGCASKIDEASLNLVLKGLPAVDDPRVLVGVPAGDDAGVYRLSDDTALVQTVDVFAPSVDDPYMFGQIAAANSVSDVYAMGGRPITAVSIIGFPIRSLPDDVMREILRGGIDKMAEAGTVVIGGHSINEKEIKAGFAVTGLIHPQKIVTHAGARPGDRLILTKPIGMGIIAFAAQIDRAPDGAAEAAAETMAALNRRAAELMVQFDAHACTDVTGFGLMGHLAAMTAASSVDAQIVWDDIPLLPGALQCAADGILPGAVERNKESSAHAAVAGENVLPTMLDICFDAQTSGGLLIAVPEPSASKLLKRLHDDGVSEAAVIGEITGPGTGKVFVRTQGRRKMPEARPRPAPVATPVPISAAPSCCTPEESSDMNCCEESDASGDQSAASGDRGLTETKRKFQEFMKAANAPGALDARTKRTVAIALSVLAKCEPCLKSHVAKAKQEGFSEEQIDEAAWMAIAFGGSPTMMFYNKSRK
jgi:selenide,water dikinase